MSDWPVGDWFASWRVPASANETWTATPGEYIDVRPWAVRAKVLKHRLSSLSQCIRAAAIEEQRVQMVQRRIALEGKPLSVRSPITVTWSSNDSGIKGPT